MSAVITHPPHLAEGIFPESHIINFAVFRHDCSNYRAAVQLHISKASLISDFCQVWVGTRSAV